MADTHRAIYTVTESAGDKALRASGRVERRRGRARRRSLAARPARSSTAHRPRPAVAEARSPEQKLQDVRDWLEARDAGQFFEGLKQIGVTALGDLPYLTEAEFKEVQMPPLKARRMLAEVSKMPQ